MYLVTYEHYGVECLSRAFSLYDAAYDHAVRLCAEVVTTEYATVYRLSPSSTGTPPERVKELDARDVRPPRIPYPNPATLLGREF